MGMTKAQLLVWVLIVGLGAGTCTVLSRVTLPEGVLAAAPAIHMAAVAAAAAEPAVVTRAVLPMADALPATIPVFPFPDDLSARTAGQVPAAAQEVATPLAAVPAFAAPDVEATAAGEAVAEIPPVPAAARPRQVADLPVDETTLYVATDALNVRATPSTDGAVLQRLALGFAIAPRRRSDDWIGFQLKDGSTGWLRTDFLSATKPEPLPATTEAPFSGEPLNLM
jgi:hypothetical protein